MSEVRPVQNRELLLDSPTRALLRRKVDPLISRALKTRGYTEERNPIGRTYLDSSNVMPSHEYLSMFNRVGFDALNVHTTHFVDPTERILSRSAIDLTTVGGFATAKLIGVGDTYTVNFSSSGDGAHDAQFENVDHGVLSEVLQDIRAHTKLGYGNQDIPPLPAEIVEELSDLQANQNVDRYAHYQLLTDEAHGDIQMNIGESFETHRIEVGGKPQIRRLNAKKIFQLIAIQPLTEGNVRLGVQYTSGRKQSEVKLSAEINGTDFSDTKKQALYEQIVHDFQHRDPSKFGSGVVRNLERIIDTASDVTRLG